MNNKLLYLETAEELEQSIESEVYKNCEFKIKANVKASYFKCVTDEDHYEDKLDLLVLKCAIKNKNNYEMISFAIFHQNLKFLNFFPDCSIDGVLKTLNQNSDKTFLITFYLKKSNASFYKILKKLEISDSALNIGDSDYNERFGGTEFLTSKFTTDATVLKFYHSSDKHRKWRCVFEVHNQELGFQKFTLWDKNVLKTIFKVQEEKDFVEEINDKFRNRKLKFSIFKVKWLKKQENKSSACNEDEALKVYFNICGIFEI
jgi:hypothetical protein